MRGRHPRYSYGKESDYGYVSGKSRDTLCNSATIDTISNIKLCQNNLTINDENINRNSIISNDYINIDEKKVDDMNTSPASSYSSSATCEGKLK